MRRKKKLPARLYDPAFRYVRSDQQGEGYLKEKFERIKREQAEKAQAEQSKVRKLGTK